MENIYLEIQGRSSIFTAIAEPGRNSVLLGAIVLENLDFLVDSLKQRLLHREKKFMNDAIE